MFHRRIQSHLARFLVLALQLFIVSIVFGQDQSVSGNLGVSGNVSSGGVLSSQFSGTPEVYLNKVGTIGWSIRNNGSFNVFNWQDGSFPLTILSNDNTILNGKVGIGTSNPASALDVTGDISTSGAITAEGGRHIVSSPWICTASTPTGYIKLVTPIEEREGNMFTIRITGFRYSSGSDTFTIQASGYAYSGNPVGSGLIQTRCRTDGTDLPVEIGMETRNGTNLVVIRIGMPSSTWYYPNFTFEYRGWQPKRAGDFSWVVGETSPAQSGNTNNVVIRNDFGPSTFNAGNVGIGTVSPATTLDVNGTIRAIGQVAPTAGAGAELTWDGSQSVLRSYDRGENTYKPLALAGSTVTIGTTGQIFLSAGDNVGIGTNSPASGHLQIQTDTNFPGIYLTGNQAGWGSGIQFANTASGGKTYGIYSSQGGAFCFADNGVGLDRIRIESGGSLNLQPTAGYVGIATANPSAQLEVNGDTKIDGNLTVSGTFSAPGYVANNGSIMGGVTGLTLNAGGTNQNVAINPSGTGNTIFGGGGNVGIGVASPTYRLDVNGNFRANGILSYSSTTAGLFSGYGVGLDGSTYQQFDLFSDTTNGVLFEAPKDSSGSKLNIQFNWRGGGVPGLFIAGANGNVGVGTATPVYRLDVSGPSSQEFVGRFIGGLSSGGSTFSSIEIGSAGETAGGAGHIGYMAAANSADSGIYLTNYGDSEQTGGIFIKKGGNVGVGTSSPDTALAVKGRIHAGEVVVDSTITATDLKVQPAVWADDVLAADHRLEPLSQVEREIKTDGHLPGIPSAKEVASNGVSVADIQARLLAKIEELTLHQIEQEKHMHGQDARIQKLESENAALRAQLK